MIWQRKLGGDSARLRPTRNVGCATGFYALGYKEPEKDDAAERAHGKLESAVAPVLKALNAGELQVGQEAWENLLFFAAVLVTRGPGTKDRLNGMRRRGEEIVLDVLAHMPLDAFMHQLKKTYPDKIFTREEAQELQEVAENPPDAFFRANNAKVIRTSLETALGTIFPMFIRMRWTYLHAPKTRPFLCSDYPVTWVDPTIPRGRPGHGLDAQNIEVSFPLGRSLALMGHRQDMPDHLVLNEELVDHFNLRTVEQARVEILGPSKESVDWGLALLTPQAP